MQAVVCLVWLFAIPSDSPGLSSQRLLLALPLLLGGLTTLALALQERRAPGWKAAVFAPQVFPQRWNAALQLSLLGISLALAIFFVLDGLARGSGMFFYKAALQRLMPLLVFAGLTCFEAFALLLSVRWQQLPALRGMLRSYAAPLRTAWLGLGSFFLLVRLADFRDIPATSGWWGSPGVPVLEWQIFLAWAAGGAFLLAQPVLLRWRRIDRLAAALIWAVTAACWIIPPLVPGYFATPPREPNFEVYPFSDGLIYAETAQSILAGSGMSNQVVPARPLYALFLAAVHAIAGQDYLRVSGLQALILALFPALIYMLAARLNLRAAGLAAAILLALQDVNANLAAPFTFNLTYSRLYFSEIPSALLITAFAWVAAMWLYQPRRAGWKPLLAGGLLGCAMLIRTQTVILIVPLLLLTLPIFFFQKDHAGYGLQQPLRSAWLRQVALCLCGLCLAVSPWIWRNYQLTGGLIFDHPVSQTMVVAQRYNDLRTSQLIPAEPGESLSQFTARLAGMALQGFLRQPGTILRRAAGHFINAQVASLEIFPLRPDLREPRELLLPLRAFWQESFPHDLNRNPPALAVLFALFGLGLAACWRAARWLGLLPLGIQLSYNLWTAVFLSSGDRFLAPVNWVSLWYYAAGLIFLARILILILNRSETQESTVAEAAVSPAGEPPLLPAAASLNRKTAALLAVLILGIGASLPLSEHLVPKRYPPASQSELRERLEIALRDIGVTHSAVFDHLKQPGGILLHGRAIYPRYYPAGEGEPETAKRGYAPEPRARLVFSLVGADDGTVVFYPSTEIEFFPHAADVLIFSENTDNAWIEPLILIVSHQGKSAVYTR